MINPVGKLWRYVKTPVATIQISTVLHVFPILGKGSHREKIDIRTTCIRCCFHPVAAFHLCYAGVFLRGDLVSITGINRKSVSCPPHQGDARRSDRINLVDQAVWHSVVMVLAIGLYVTIVFVYTEIENPATCSARQCFHRPRSAPTRIVTADSHTGGRAQAGSSSSRIEFNPVYRVARRLTSACAIPFTGDKRSQWQGRHYRLRRD